jgi:tetratricopeptide (TPR) repeat protein
MWNGLSVVCLTGFVAHMTSLAPLFATGGFGILESFGLLGPSSLMALALSSLQGGAGKEAIGKILKLFKIPPRFESEFTFGMSALLLASAIATQANLPNIAKFYFQHGLKYYEQGLLKKAEQQYKQALSLDPDNSEINIALGEVYESLGDLEQARKEYKHSLQEGDPKGFNHLGRVYVQQGNKQKAEALFRIGLQLVKDDLSTKFQLHRNLGWVLLDQKQYDQAILELETAIQLDKQIPGRQIGGGMANCFLANILEIQGKQDIAQQQWGECEKLARPETINEYKWLVDVGRRDIASRVDTSSIVAGEEKSSTVKGD